MKKRHNGPRVPRYGAALLLLVLTAACSKHDSPAAQVVPKDTAFTATYETSTLPVSDRFRLQDTFHLKTSGIPEVSGLARATGTPGALYWGEQDSGNPSGLYLVDTLGRLLGTLYLDGVFNRDWEDIAAGPGPDKGKFYLYAGDIGDNFNFFPFITVYRLPAPKPAPGSWTDTLIHQFDVLNFVYPDGPHNAEAFIVDPLSLNIYVFTKESQAAIYVARYPQSTTQAGQLVKLGTIPVSTVTAADITADGTGIVVKNYDDSYYWSRQPGESIATALARQPLRLAYHKEPQGEAIVWDGTGKGFFTLSEKAGSGPQILYHYISK